MKVANPPVIAYSGISAVAASDYLPVVNQGGNLASYTTQVGHSIQLGKLVNFWGKVVVNNATGAVAGTLVQVTLPVNARFDQTNFVCGTASLYDLSATQMFKGHMVMLGINTMAFFPSSDASVDATNFHLGSKIFTAALATGDILIFSGQYEAA